MNLLQEQDLKVTFNEGRTAWLDVIGKDASSAALGLTTLEWNSKEDVEKSIEELNTLIVDTKKQLFDLRLQKSLQKLENTAQIRQLKTLVAQAKTLIKEKSEVK